VSCLILGPPGVLPPGGWAVGACVSTCIDLEAVTDDKTGTSAAQGFIIKWAGNTPEVFVPRYRATVSRGRLWETRLDLTTGPLGFGTRALLSLVAPEVEQPLTAPGWAHDAELDIWRLVGPVEDFIQESDPFPERTRIKRFDDLPGFCSSETSGMYRGVIGWAGPDEPDPRRALALALTAAKGPTP